MTPQERQLINELFQRLASLENNPRDPDAEAMIREGLRRAPNAVYSLVQSVLVQDEALKAANNRIQDYEQQSGGPQQEENSRAASSTPCARRSSAATSSAAPCRACRRAGRWPADGPTRGAAAGLRAQQGYPQQQGYPPGYQAGAPMQPQARRRRRLIPGHCGGRGGRHDRRLAPDERHPLRDGWPSGWWAGIEGVREFRRRRGALGRQRGGQRPFASGRAR